MSSVHSGGALETQRLLWHVCPTAQSASVWHSTCLAMHFPLRQTWPVGQSGSWLHWRWGMQVLLTQLWLTGQSASDRHPGFELCSHLLLRQTWPVGQSVSRVHWG